MTRVAKFEKADATIAICIIGLLDAYTKPEANIARFDFGICMAAFVGDKIIRAAEFDRDAEGQTFTLCRADNQAQFAYSMSRFEKITAGRSRQWLCAVADQRQNSADGTVAIEDHD
jgi:hypothetical protein